MPTSIVRQSTHRICWHQNRVQEKNIWWHTSTDPALGSDYDYVRNHHNGSHHSHHRYHWWYRHALTTNNRLKFQKGYFRYRLFQRHWHLHPAGLNSRQHRNQVPQSETAQLVYFQDHHNHNHRPSNQPPAYSILSRPSHKTDYIIIMSISINKTAGLIQQQQ